MEGIARQSRQQALAVVLIQLGLATVLSALFLLFSGWQSALSVFIGGSISAAANFIMIRIMFAGWTANSPKGAQRAFYVAEIMKLVVSIVLFILVILFMSPMPAQLMIGFSASVMVYWVALIFSRPVMVPVR